VKVLNEQQFLELIGSQPASKPQKAPGQQELF